jgi:1,4-alpha-glucan branching enzyme
MDSRVVSPESVRVALESVARGTCGNPVATLGCHRDADGWQVRTFQLAARAVSLVDASGELVTIMERTDIEGVFVGALPLRQRERRLRIDDGMDTRDVEDPYRFPSPLGELDLYRLGEGRHHRVSDKPGAADTEPHASHGRPCSLRLAVPPLATLILLPSAAAEH